MFHAVTQHNHYIFNSYMTMKNSRIHDARLKSHKNEKAIINRLNIIHKVCREFAPSHEEENIGLDYLPFQPQKHKISKNRHDQNHSDETNAESIDEIYGQLKCGSKFIKCHINTPLEKVEKVLLNAWKISRPRCIISIIGGAKYFKITQQMEKYLIDSIVALTRKPDVCILTSGYNTGIVHFVGQALSKAALTTSNGPVTAIGLPKSGAIRDFQAQISTNTITQNSTRQKSVTNQRNTEHVKGQWDLEINHSHFLLLTDDKSTGYETKDYRTNLAKHLSKTHDSDPFVPTVTIVAEGGMDTIRNIYYDLKNYIPVVILNNTGRAADFFARWLSITKSFDAKSDLIGHVIYFETLKTVCDSERDGEIQFNCDSQEKIIRTLFNPYQTELKKDFESLFLKGKPPKDSGNQDKEIDMVMFCLQPAIRHYITVCNLSSSLDLPDVVLRTIFRCHNLSLQRELHLRENRLMSNRHLSVLDADHNKRMKKESAATGDRKKAYHIEQFKLLELAIDWESIDIAKEFVLKNKLDNIFNPDEAFLNALRLNSSEFVHEFLRLGYKPNQFFFPDNGFMNSRGRYKVFIDELYSSEKMKDCIKEFQELIAMKSTRGETTVSSTDVLNSILKEVLGDYIHTLYYNTYTDELNELKEYGLSSLTLGNLTVNDVKLSTKEQIQYDYIMRDLFIWAVLTGRVELARTFLAHMKYRVCAALIASKIFKEYHTRASYDETKNSYLNTSKKFEEYAIDCINYCFKENPDDACAIVLQANELYGYVTCLQVASNARAQLFLASPCCVQAIRNAWYGEMDSIQPNGKFLVFSLGIISLGLLAPLIKFRESGKEKTSIADANKHRLQSNGITYCDPSTSEYTEQTLIGGTIATYLKRVQKFHLSPPMKFCYHVAYYLFFLLLFSYVLLFQFQPPTDSIPSIHWTEILTIILVSCFLIEEIQCTLCQDDLSLFSKIKNHITDPFKIIRWLAVTLFYIGLIVRFRYALTSWNFVVARVIMAFDLELWWCCSLSFIIVNPYLGPHLVAIRKMLKDLVFFLIILGIVLFGYGVSSRSMVYYPLSNSISINNEPLAIDTTFSGRAIFRQIVYPVYYLLFGEFGNELNVLDSVPDAGWSIATHVLLAIHMMFVNIVLINLLIAMFSKHFGEIYDDAKNVWHSQQYIFIREYFTRSPFFPPISLFIDIFYIGYFIFSLIKRSCFKVTEKNWQKEFKIKPKTYYLVDKWCNFEYGATHEYANSAISITTSDRQMNKAKIFNDAFMRTKSEKAKFTHDISTGLHQLECLLFKFKSMEEQRTEKKKA